MIYINKTYMQILVSYIRSFKRVKKRCLQTLARSGKAIDSLINMVDAKE